MPASKPYHFHPQAWQDLESADSWYRQRNPEASIRFLAGVYEALEDISRWPQAWADHLYGTRKFVLPHFPYAVIYREKETAIQILAIAHGHRGPGYWKDRF
jgi:plasmid stabilization system protein ParE